MATSTTTRRTTVVTEVPDERRWQGRDWVKGLVAGGLALSLLRPGATTAPVAAPTAVAVATPIPAIVATPVATALPTVAATVAPTVAATAAPTVAATVGLPGAAAPVITVAGAAVQAGPYAIQGTGSPGSLVEVLVNGASVGTATVDGDGAWSLPTTLEAGAAEIVARAVNEAGAVIIEGEPVALEVGAAAAGGGTGSGASGVAAEVAVPTFTLPAGDLTGGPNVLSGTGTPGTAVRVTIGGVDAGIAVVGPDGSWTLDAILADGQQEVVVEAVDASGAVLAAAEPVTVNVVGGLGVTLAEPAEGAELQPGPVTISGQGQAGTVLEILNGDLVLGEVTIGPDGTWTTEVPLEAGTSAISVREQGTDIVLTRPVRVTVGDAPAAAAGCGDELAVGCQAWVTRAGGLQLRMRSAPTIAADNIITRLPIGTEMALAEGPESADGLSWWRVTTVGGNEGWVAGEFLVTQPD